MATAIPPQHQNQQPGIESQMNPHPVFDDANYKGSGRLQGKVAIITGGDSGIGRAVSIAFAKEGANIVIVYLNEHEDANETKQFIEQKGTQCLLLSGDIGNEQFCNQVIAKSIEKFGHLEIIVNNAGEQHVQNGLEMITTKQLQRTFQTNFFAVFYLTRAALPHIQPGARAGLHPGRRARVRAHRPGQGP